jgi:uncharacterized protein YegP (UPF0339 family)
VNSPGAGIASRLDRQADDANWQSGREGDAVAKAKFEIYADTGGNHRWRLKDGNGEKVASSGESFDSKSNAKRAAQNVKDTAPDAEIED